MAKTVTSEIRFNQSLREKTKLPMRSEHPERDITLIGNSPQRGESNVMNAKDLIATFGDSNPGNSVGNLPESQPRQANTITQSEVIEIKTTENIANETAPIENSGAE